MANKGYKKKDFESTEYYSDENGNRRKDTSANIYESMLLSKAWQELTAQQQALYVVCKSQYYNLKKKPSLSESEPHGNERHFYMNRYLWNEKYVLYKRNNAGGFHRDMAALIEKGFLRCVWRGMDTKSKSVYAFSSKWQKYPDFEIPTEDMTSYMRTQREKP